MTIFLKQVTDLKKNLFPSLSRHLALEFKQKKSQISYTLQDIAATNSYREIATNCTMQESTQCF